MFFIYNSNGLRVMDAYLHRYVVVADDDSFNNIIVKDVFIQICHKIIDI
jgi:hypothetical protein